MSKFLSAFTIAFTLSGTVLPTMAATITAGQNVFVYNATPNGTQSSASGLTVAARGPSYDRKIYLDFDLTELPGQEIGGTSLTLTLNSTPLLGPAPGSVSYTLPIELYAIVDGTGAFTASSTTWMNAPKNNTSSSTGFLENGVVSLGIANILITPTSGSTLQNTTVTWSGAALDNLLGWAAGNLGDFYGTGVTSSNSITLMIGSNGATSHVGLNFYSLTSAGSNTAYKPHLDYAMIPEPGTALFLTMATGMMAMAGLRSRRHEKR